MSSTPILEAVARVIERLPATYPIQIAAAHLVDGYDDACAYTAVAAKAGWISQAERERLLARHRGQLLTQLRRLAGQVGKGGVQ